MNFNNGIKSETIRSVLKSKMKKLVIINAFISICLLNTVSADVDGNIYLLKEASNQVYESACKSRNGMFFHNNFKFELSKDHKSLKITTDGSKKEAIIFSNFSMSEEKDNKFFNFSEYLSSESFSLFEVSDIKNSYKKQKRELEITVMNGQILNFTLKTSELLWGVSLPFSSSIRNADFECSTNVYEVIESENTLYKYGY